MRKNLPDSKKLTQDIFDEENLRQWDMRELGADPRYARSVPMSPKLRRLLDAMRNKRN